MAEQLEDVLADVLGDAAVLRKAGNDGQAKYLEELAARIRESAEDWLTWLSEGDAVMRSGFGLDWLRGRFEVLRRDGHARMNGRVRQYRACAIPRKANTVTAANRGRDAARQARKVS